MDSFSISYFKEPSTPGKQDTFIVYGDTFAIIEICKAIGGKRIQVLTHPYTRSALRGVWRFPITQFQTFRDLSTADERYETTTTMVKYGL